MLIIKDSIGDTASLGLLRLKRELEYHSVLPFSNSLGRATMISYLAYLPCPSPFLSTALWPLGTQHVKDWGPGVGGDDDDDQGDSGIRI